MTEDLDVEPALSSGGAELASGSDGRPSPPRDVAPQVAGRLRKLEVLTAVSPSDLSVEDLLNEVLQRLRSLFAADTAAVLLLDDSGDFLSPVAACGLEEEVHQGVRIPLGRGFAGTIAARAVPVVLSSVTPATVVNPILIDKGMESMLGVPLLDGERVVGVLHIGTFVPRHFGEDDVAVLQVAAERIVTAIVSRRASLDRAAATALQRSLSPRRLPEVPGYQLAARYVPGSQFGVGGDWYDVFSLPEGQVGVVIGDVMGHGLRAATIMGRLKSALRAYTLDYDDPAVVLGHLDRKLCHFEPGQTATLIYAILDPTTGLVRYSSAGHLPLIAMGPAAPAEVLEDRHGLPLGVDPQFPRRSSTLSLARGALLCLLTDGLIDQRNIGIDDGLRNACTALRSLEAHCDPAETACVRLMHDLVGTRRPDDDITVLALSRNPGDPEGG